MADSLGIGLFGRRTKEKVEGIHTASDTFHAERAVAEQQGVVNGSQVRKRGG